MQSNSRFNSSVHEETWCRRRPAAHQGGRALCSPTAQPPHGTPASAPPAGSSQGWEGIVLPPGPAPSTGPGPTRAARVRRHRHVPWRCSWCQAPARRSGTARTGRRTAEWGTRQRGRRHRALRRVPAPRRYLPVDVPADGDGRGDGLHVGLLQQQVAHVVAQALREHSG